MHILIDFVLLLIIAVPIITAVYRGFVKSISRIASLVVALIVAFVGTGFLFDFVDNSGYKAKLEEKLSVTFINMTESNEKAEEDINDDKSEISEYLAKIGIDTDEIKQKLETGKDNAINSIADAASSKIADKLTYCICFAALFIASYIIVVIIFWIISKANNLPVLKHFDKLLGGILGLITALVLAVVFISLTKTIVPYLQSAYPNAFPETVIEDTFIFKYAEPFVPAIISNTK